ncbi:MAG: TIGR04283 family arsenosugar biosynthesis glycosyltransferase [Gammaproteobacteria bacterium]|nr:TIGR04283 family arsenosugar biosynthesis glycosyltransferase [Gammaproteobacteria bacterium]
MDQEQIRSRLREISIIIPVRDDREKLSKLLQELREYPEFEVVVVDYQSTDDPGSLDFEFVFCESPVVGRGNQIYLGIEHATRDRLWILHADTTLNQAAIAGLACAFDTHKWGSFNVHIRYSRWMYRVVETMMNLRSRLTGISTGDQGVFVERELLEAIGGFPQIPLMEDIALCTRLKKIYWPYRIKAKIGTSARRWERDGIWKTIVQMWRYRYRYFRGHSTTKLYREYYHD